MLYSENTVKFLLRTTEMEYDCLAGNIRSLLDSANFVTEKIDGKLK